jgi:UPF0271 protein
VGRSVDLNADLGEGQPGDEALLDLVTSASIACGVHAGSPSDMLKTASRAASRGVVLGAHPSYWDREGFGRRDMDVRPEELVAVLVYQIGAMAAVAASAGAALRFVKPHGALYNRAAVDASVAEAVVGAVRFSGIGSLALLCPGGSALADRARALHVPVFLEAFADRSYKADGTLMSREQAGSVLTDPELVAGQAVRLATEGTVVACDGSVVRVETDSICVHGDTAGAVDLARGVRQALERAGVTVEAFVRS